MPGSLVYTVLAGFFVITKSDRLTTVYVSAINDKDKVKMRNFILGSDWWTDCDDAVAVRILARAHKAGEICLRGIGINACMEDSVRALDGFLQSEGVCGIAIGIDPEASDFGGNPPYQKRLASLPSKYSSNQDAEDAVRLYRRILAESTEPVEIIEIGYLQVIANVIESEPDDLSDMDGMELIKEKVSKIWVMAGKWDDNPGRENNFTRNPRSRAAGNIFCEKCPVPVTFLGWEVGADVITGDALDENDILYRVLCDHGSRNGRMSWDPMLVLLAIIGDEAAAGYHAVRGTASVDSQSGENRFTPCDEGRHQYVVRKMPDEYYKKAINKLIADRSCSENGEN